MASQNLAASSVATFPRLLTQAALPPASRRLDPQRPTDELRPLEETLERRVKGQDPALTALLSALARPLSGLKDPHRPHLSALLLGPTGIGKTETAKAVAEGLLGSETHLVRVNCESFAHSHEVAKLLGSPPGYVGQNIEPLLSQQRLDAGHLSLISDGTVPPLLERMSGSEDARLSVILFDEIEKADPVLWTTLLGVLEDGTITLGDNTTSSFQGSVIFVTSNVGGREMAKLVEKPAMGFGHTHEGADLDLSGAAVQAAQETFPLELINRFDEVIVYSALDRTDLETILDKFLAELHDRALKQAEVPLLIRLSDEARDHIVETGTDPRFGARPLRRAVERLLVDPLSRLIASRQLSAGDVVEVELEENTLAFYRQGTAAQNVVA